MVDSARSVLTAWAQSEGFAAVHAPEEPRVRRGWRGGRKKRQEIHAVEGSEFWVAGGAGGGEGGDAGGSAIEGGEAAVVVPEVAGAGVGNHGGDGVGGAGPVGFEHGLPDDENAEVSIGIFR